MTLDLVSLLHGCSVLLAAWYTCFICLAVLLWVPVARAGVATLATYRCQESSNRVQLRLRTLEGQHGELQALVVNRNLPKSATLLRVPVKPLSLHHRLAESNETIAAGLQAAWSAVVKSYAELASTAPPAGATSHASTALAVPPPATYPFGQLTVTGSFTLSQMHEWIAGSLPDAPARASSECSPARLSAAARTQPMP